MYFYIGISFIVYALVALQISQVCAPQSILWISRQLIVQLKKMRGIALLEIKPRWGE